jgi:hypothetical protein
VSGAAVGGTIGLMEGPGIGATFPAFPMPEGSLTEPLSPLTFPGPGGTPLTPAESWAIEPPASRIASAPPNNALLPICLPAAR